MKRTPAKYQQHDYVKIISNNLFHGFAINEIVIIRYRHPGSDQHYRAIAPGHTHDLEGWWVHEVDIELHLPKVEKI